LQHQTQEPQLLTLGQAAARLGVTYRTVRRWVACGRVVAIDLGSTGRGPTWRLSANELERIKREGRNRA
jgi:excisionase family DNA binding protein